MVNDYTILIGFDFGMRHIGVAVGQTVSQSATPQPILPAKDGIPCWKNITSLVMQWSASAFVVGEPCNMDGSDQEITFAARKFANCLREKFRLPVYLVDERLTTKAAITAQKKAGKTRKSMVATHSYAAKIILEDWLRTEAKNAPSATFT